MIKHEANIAGKKVAVTYTGGVFTNGRVTSTLFVGVGGDVNIKLTEDSAFGVMKLGAGYHPLAVKEISQTGTTATGMFLLL
jgi:hypothetical protein